MSTTRSSGTPGGLDDPYPGVESTRRGAHRARPTPLMAALPAVAVVVVVVLVAFGVYSLLGGAGGGGSDDNGPAAGAEVSPTVSGGASPSPSGDAQQSPDTSDEPATEEPEPDKTVKVTVLNNTGTPGLAKGGKKKLEADGWNVVAIGDHKPRGSVATTTVFYSTEEQKVTAEAISEVIGVGGVEEASEIAGEGITVVLSTDFTP
jgi:LytR cell envelope-related transcriptional attenuator